MSSYAERPTLPPLHTLNLLPESYLPRRTYDSYDPMARLHVPHRSWQSHRRVSTSSSSTRTPSPSPSDASTSSSPSKPNAAKLTLIPCSFEDADAVIVVPSSGKALPDNKGFLLTGQALTQLRQRTMPKDVRMHPYRFTPSGSRRTSAS
ncbi:hypothetical protein C8F01DRAFT_1128931 [Mycena amicta]|nr:hypothetical protein C8F01DRAFT_1128931 [Mycena amicta]